MRFHLRVVVTTLACLLSSCVTGTPYQRALDLQDEAPDPDEVLQSLADRNWKLRCLAARACGRVEGAACLEATEGLSLKDYDDRVRACAVEGIVARCDRGGRDALARVAQQYFSGAAPDAPESIAQAVEACHSADAVLAMAMAQQPRHRAAVARLTGMPEPPSEAHDLVRYLSGLLNLPSPRLATDRTLAEAREQVRHLDADAAAREEERRGEDAARKAAASRHLQDARAALAAGDLDAAARSLAEAAGLGADVDADELKLEEAKKAKGREHRDRAWKLAAKKKHIEAEQERLRAVALGYDDQELAAAIVLLEWKALRNPSVVEIEEFITRHGQNAPRQATVALEKARKREAEAEARAAARAEKEARARGFRVCTGYKLMVGFVDTCTTLGKLNDLWAGRAVGDPRPFCKCVGDRLSERLWKIVRKHVLDESCTVSPEVLSALFDADWVRYECGG